jgi:serine/threonine-protein kinase
VIDFGIAKATTNQEATQAGVIKGKPSYLSPEQISGEALDGRSDVFALGAVLWEVLTGRKLFAGDNDLAVLKMIEACQTHVKPPSTLNPKVPKELDYIVLRSLAKQREKRFQSAEEMQRALHKFLYNYYPEFNPTDLSYYARDLFKNEIVEDRKRILKLSEKAEQVLANLKSSESTQARAASSQISPPKQPASAPLNHQSLPYRIHKLNFRTHPKPLSLSSHLPLFYLIKAQFLLNKNVLPTHLGLIQSQLPVKPYLRQEIRQLIFRELSPHHV